MTDFLTRRGAVWHFVRRVPVEFASIDGRGIVRHTTRIKIADDRVGRRAARVALKLNDELERFWHGMATDQGLVDTREARVSESVHQLRPGPSGGPRPVPVRSGPEQTA